MNTKHAWIGILTSLALVLGFAGTSMAFSNSGTWMFTESGNDSNTSISDLESFIESWFDDNGYIGSEYDDIGLEEYAKVDAPDTSNDGLAVTYASDGKSGTWDTGAAVDFYSVKAGNSYAFYWEDPAAVSGTWDTSDVEPVGKKGNQPSISHITTWIMNPSGGGGGGGGNAPVPEPSTVFLMGLGLAGLGFTSYRKGNRK
jgi:hypothetical protein